MKNENFITIQGWMRNTLNLKGSELICYALVYGFSQDGETEFEGSITYISEWLGVTRANTISVIERLAEKGLIVKIEPTMKGGVCRYKAGSIETIPGVVLKQYQQGSIETIPNNIDNITIKEVKEESPFEDERLNEVWRTLRREKKWKDKSSHALELSIRKLKAMTPEQAICSIETTIERGYQGVFPPKPYEFSEWKIGKEEKRKSIEELMSEHYGK